MARRPADLRAHRRDVQVLSRASRDGKRDARVDAYIAKAAPFARPILSHLRALVHRVALSPGKQREYLAWIAEAKRPETRAKRIETTIEWAAKGKSLNWKYERC